MEKNEVLELLRDKARQISDLEKWFNSNDHRRLSEYAAVWRLINFKVQDIVTATPKNELENALLVLHTDLFTSMEKARENQIIALQELYGAALDYLQKVRGLLSDYLP